MARQLILSVDQGTTSTRALLVDTCGQIMASHSEPIMPHYPQGGWVEHDGEEIFATVARCCRKALQHVNSNEVLGIGIANQRETTLLWDRATGRPLYRAIVWQDRRTHDICERLRREGLGSEFQDRTGLLLDPYFSGTKLAWLLENVPGAREKARAGTLAFGTVDSWIIWNLTRGAHHLTDATNASRTLLFNIRSNEWDREILSWLDIPGALLPEVKDCAADFGVTSSDVIGAELPILGVAGDQQAAAIGQACLKPGMVKSTYGTGCFMLLNTGAELPQSKNRLLSTIAYRLEGRIAYALEGSIFMAGATIDWLKDVGLVASEDEASALASKANPNSACYLVPGFTGLGAPYWSADARGALLGMTRDTGRAEIAAAALDSAAYQTRDLLEAMAADTGAAIPWLRVDGGMTKSEAFLERLADLTGTTIERAANTEATAFGAACLAGLQAGAFADLAAIEKLWTADRSVAPRMTAKERETRYSGWRKAVQRTL